MRKSFLFLLLITASVVSFAQKSSAIETSVIVNEQIKKALVSELQLSTVLADRVVVVEDEFYSRVSAIKALKETPIKQKAKIREAIIIRNQKLTAVPLTPRQAEDVMMIVENIRRKHTSK